MAGSIQTDQKQTGEVVALDDMLVVLRNILAQIVSPEIVDLTINRIRGTFIVESGTITTLTTLTTLSNAVNIDGIQGRILMFSTDETAWANCVRSRIS